MLHLQQRAEKADERIAALGEITLGSDKALEAVSDEVSELPQEVRSLMKNLPLLKEKQDTLEKLREKSAYDKLFAQENPEDLRSSIDGALAFLNMYPNSSMCSEVEAFCVECYLLLAAQQRAEELNASAEKNLEECRDRAFAADGGKAQEALDRLQAQLEAKRPVSGYLLSESGCQGGYCQLVIEAGYDDVLIKVQSVDDPDEKYLTMYVRASESAKVNLQDGRYTLKYASGMTWYGTKEYFGRLTQFTMADTIINLETRYNGSYVYYDIQTITLIKSAWGNLRSSDIGANDFDSRAIRQEET